MIGESIGLVKYMQGHSNLGDQTIFVELAGHSSNLTVQRINGESLFSIPWGNFGGAQGGSIYKNGLAIAGALLVRSIPLLNLTNAASSFYDGVWIDYWDEEIERNQRVFFDTGSERKARQVVLKIYQFRDQYHRSVGKLAKPTVRQNPGPTARLTSRSSAKKAIKSTPRKTSKSTAPKRSQSPALKTSKPPTRKVSTPTRGKKK